MASAQVVETSVANNSTSQDSNHPDDLFQSRYLTPGFKPFSYLLLYTYLLLYKGILLTQGSTSTVFSSRDRAQFVKYMNSIRSCNLISPVDSSLICFRFIFIGPNELVQNISGPHWPVLRSRHFIIQYAVKRTMKYDIYFILSLKTLRSFILRRTKKKLYSVLDD